MYGAEIRLEIIRVAALAKYHDFVARFKCARQLYILR